jgi:NADH-quinone oxidoreductase subunit M
MPFDHAVVILLLTVPLAAAIFVASLGPNRGPLIRWVSLGASLVELVLALVLAGRYMNLEHTVDLGAVPTFAPEFVPGSSPPAPHRTQWDMLQVGSGKIQFFIGVDGLNIWLLVLTAVLLLPSVLVSWTYIRERVNEFYAWLLALQTALFGVFLSFDIMLFYVFFELSLVPLFFLIGIWGGAQRRYAACKFFVFTLAGSLILLLGILGLVLAVSAQTGEMTFSLPRLVELVHGRLALEDPAEKTFWAGTQFWVFIAIMIGFAVKVPLVPLHTWLPLAHVEAPTAGSVDLAGVLLKIGAYGFMRVCIPLAPDTSLVLGMPLVTSLAAIGIVYGALCAYSQDDVKKLIAYSSVSHLGLVMMGMFSLTAIGLQGSLFQMISHGLSTGALFLLIGMIYERYHTRDLKEYGGMATRMPLFAVLMVFFCLSSAGLPGLNGFTGEVLCLFGIGQFEWQYRQSLVLTAIAASGMFLGAWYLMTMMWRLLFGEVREPEGHSHDLLPREWLLLAPIGVLCILLGVYPRPLLRAAQPEVDMVAYIADLARQRAGIQPMQARLPPGKPRPAVAEAALPPSENVAHVPRP